MRALHSLNLYFILFIATVFINNILDCESVNTDLFVVLGSCHYIIAEDTIQDDTKLKELLIVNKMKEDVSRSTFLFYSLIGNK